MSKASLQQNSTRVIAVILSAAAGSVVLFLYLEGPAFNSLNSESYALFKTPLSLPPATWIGMAILEIAKAALFVLASLGSGRVLVSRFLPDDLPRNTRVALYWGLGTGFLALALFVMGITGLLTLYPVVGLFLFCAVGGLLTGSLRPGTRKPPARNHHGSPSLKVERVLTMFLVVLLSWQFLLHMAESFGPPLADDALIYHLPVARTHAERGVLRDIPEILWSRYPGNTEVLYASGFVIGGESTVRLINLALTAQLAFLLFALASQFTNRTYALLASVIFLRLLPLTKGATSGNIDTGTALFQVTALIALVCLMRYPGRWAAGVGGIATGLAIGCRYTGLLHLAAAILLILLFAHRRKSCSLKQAAGLASLWFLTAMVVASPWFIRNLIVCGNPVFPYFYSLFPTKGWSEVAAESFRSEFLNRYGSGRSAADLIRLPWNFVMERFHYDVAGVNPLFLILPIWYAWVRRRKKSGLGVLGLYAGLIFVCWALLLPHSGRYLLAVFAICSLLLAHLIEEANEALPRGGVLLIGLVMVALILPSEQRLQGQALPSYAASLSLEAREELLVEHVPGYRCFQALDKHAKDARSNGTRDETETVRAMYIPGAPRRYYCRTPLLYGDYRPDYDPWISDPFAPAGALKGDGVRYLVYDTRPAGYPFAWMGNLYLKQQMEADRFLLYRFRSGYDPTFTVPNMQTAPLLDMPALAKLHRAGREVMLLRVKRPADGKERPVVRMLPESRLAARLVFSGDRLLSFSTALARSALGIQTRMRLSISWASGGDSPQLIFERLWNGAVDGKATEWTEHLVEVPEAALGGDLLIHLEAMNSGRIAPVLWIDPVLMPMEPPIE